MIPAGVYGAGASVSLKTHFVPAASAEAMVRGPRVLVAEQHGHLKHVPSELQCQVRAYEDVAARCLDRGQNRVEPEVADQLGYRIRRWLALAPLSRLPVLPVSGRGYSCDVDPPEVP